MEIEKNIVYFVPWQCPFNRKNSSMLASGVDIFVLFDFEIPVARSARKLAKCLAACCGDSQFPGVSLINNDIVESK